MFAHVNLEAEVHLVDTDSETIPIPTQAVTLVIRQGIEVLVKGSNGHPAAAVFIELCQGQVRASIWDTLSASVVGDPITYVLKDVTEKEKKL